MKYFTIDEFKCPCCGVVNMDPDFLDMLDAAREHVGIPLIVDSGYRCEKHNKEIHSTALNHPSGKAADIRTADGSARYHMLEIFLYMGFTGIGIGKTFLHVDTFHQDKTCWLYEP